MADDLEPRAPWRERLALNSEDVRSFLMTYCACLVAVTTFII